MSAPDHPSTSQDSESQGSRPPRRKHPFLITLGALLLLIPVLYMEEAWRGARDWEACKRRYEAQGFVLDWNRLIPPPVPDNQNVLTAPRMVSDATWKP